MEIALALVIAAAIGIAVHFALPHRQSRGAVIAPMTAAAAGAVAWMALTWAGLGTDNPWIWLASVVVPAAVSAALVLIVGRARVRGDLHERARLGLL
jgi:hypothetical protein